MRPVAARTCDMQIHDPDIPNMPCNLLHADVSDELRPSKRHCTTTRLTGVKPQKTKTTVTAVRTSDLFMNKIPKFPTAPSTQIPTTDESSNELLIFRLHRHILFIFCVILTYTALSHLKPEIYLNIK